MAKRTHKEETKEQLVDYFCKQAQVKRLTSTPTPPQHSEHGVPHSTVWNIRALLSPGVEQIGASIWTTDALAAQRMAAPLAPWCGWQVGWDSV